MIAARCRGYRKKRQFIVEYLPLLAFVLSFQVNLEFMSQVVNKNEYINIDRPGLKIDFWNGGHFFPWGDFINKVFFIERFNILIFDYLIFDQRLYSNRREIFCYILEGSFREYVNKIYSKFCVLFKRVKNII